jgi:hypothetical protein
MQSNDKLQAIQEQRPSDLETVEDLGRHVHRLAALLRAASSTGDHDDEAWLVSMASDEAEQAERCYAAWGAAPRGGRA